MPIRVTIEADSADELKQALVALVSEAKTAPSADPAAPASPPAPLPHPPWVVFLEGLPENQRKVLETVQQAGGQIGLRDLERALGMAGQSQAGAIRSLNRAGMAAYGADVLQPQAWLQLPDGTWDRLYVLNPDLRKES